MQRTNSVTANLCKVGTLILLAVLLLAGCGSPVARFQTRVPAEIDVGDIERVAVADFDGLDQTGRFVTAKLTQGIVENGHFRMFEREKLEEILYEREFGNSEHVNPETANRLKLLGVDALIFGTVDVFSVDDQTGISKFETKIGTGEYETVKEKDRSGRVHEVKTEIMRTVLIDRGHVIREGTMGVTFRMANVNTGEIVAIKTETVHFSEKAWEDETHHLPTKDVILDDLSSRVTGRFLRQIQPQYVVRAVRFEENDLVETDLAIKYAQAGLWDEAALTLSSVAVAAPSLASAHYNLGVVYDALGRYDAAARSVERAVRLEPKDKYIQALAQIKRHADEATALPWQGTAH
jgi:tetratricopeptide (TPR) repeat protein